MDPLSALSVAASAVQFVDFGCKLFSKSKEIYNSADGTPIGQQQAGNASKRLVELTDYLKKSLRVDQNRQSTPEDKALDAICNGCIEISNKLLATFEKLQVQNGTKYRRWASYQKAFISISSKREVDAMVSRLQSYKEELDTHVLVSLRWVIASLFNVKSCLVFK